MEIETLHDSQTEKVQGITDSQVMGDTDNTDQDNTTEKYVADSSSDKSIDQNPQSNSATQVESKSSNIDGTNIGPQEGAAMKESSALGYSIPDNLKIKRDDSVNTIIRKKSEVISHVLNVQAGQISKFRDIERSIRETESRREFDANKLREVKDDVMILRFDLDQEVKRNNQLEKQNEELSNTIIGLRHSVNKMHSQIDNVEFLYEKQDREFQSMTNRLRASESLKAVLEQENKELVEELSSQNEAMNKSIQDLKRTSGKLKIAEAERGNLEAELKKYRDAYGNMGFLG